MKAMTLKDKARDARIRREYPPFTLEKYNAVLKEQGNCCGICKVPNNAPVKSGKRKGKPSNNFAVDHCHKTGLVRGLLCMRCNRALGKFEDSVERVQSAAAYVTSPPATTALGKAQITAPGQCGTKVRAKALAKMKQGVYGRTQK